MQNKKRLLLIILAVIVPVLLAAAAIRENLRLKDRLPEGFSGSNGRLELRRMDVAALYPGRVVSIAAEEGTAVKKDDVLVVLSSEQSDSQVAAANAARQRAAETVARADAEIAAMQQQYKVAQMDWENTRRLKNDALVSAAELQRRQAAKDGAAAAVAAARAARAEAVSAVNQAQAQADAAGAANRDMQIRAPLDARVEYRIADVGNVVGAGSRVITLLDPTDLTLSVFLPTRTVGQLHLGDEARVVLDGIDAVWQAKISFIAAEAQFTPKYVETVDERDKLMYRVKLRIPIDSAKPYTCLLKGGLTGNGYVRLDTKQVWPEKWRVRAPAAACAP
ncbi:HlyD family secretion protein [Stenoxybacter acetivorans]|uniref:HlyD family secretion protein n=1 Tax=Stenoxybacter acetivorans TaxID=422441 RepID=UPI000A781D40|nr:HlyD family efflux transporter periplasmic adaptor subunit [Stenoxybacter acetivorans]